MTARAESLVWGKKIGGHKMLIPCHSKAIPKPSWAPVWVLQSLLSAVASVPLSCSCLQTPRVTLTSLWNHFLLLSAETRGSHHSVPFPFCSSPNQVAEKVASRIAEGFTDTALIMVKNFLPLTPCVFWPCCWTREVLFSASFHEEFRFSSLPKCSREMQQAVKCRVNPQRVRGELFATSEELEAFSTCSGSNFWLQPSLCNLNSYI